MKKKDIKLLRKEFMEKMEREFDCSWGRYLININRDNLDKNAIFYRGKSITYREMFANSFRYARAMKAMGLKKNMEVPMCLNLCPETIYTIIAASLIGIRVNLFGSDFDPDYIKMIINSTDSNIMFATDDVYGNLKDIVPNTGIRDVVMFSLTDSYPNGVNPYYELEKDFYDGINKVPKYKEETQGINILDVYEFEYLSNTFEGPVEEKGSLEDIFSTTYSSGTTNSTRPKGIVHKTKTYISMGLAHYLGGDTTRLVGVRCYSAIPTHSNTSLVSTISDSFSQEQQVALEYIRDKHFFPISLQINKPNMCAETRSYWIQAIKDYNSDNRFANVDLKFLLAAFSIGEPTSKGEEKFINRGFKRFKAGHNFTKGLVTLPIGMAGGDCEHSGIFFLPFKSVLDKIPSKLIKKEETGYQTYRMVDWAILDKDGNHCGPYEHGVLVANSPSNMVGYRYCEDANDDFFVQDNQGKTYGSFRMHSYYDAESKLHLKGRMKFENEIPLYLIQDEILKDTKNIMSCELVEVGGNYVAHIEFQPDVHVSKTKALISMEARLSKAFPADVVSRIVYRIRDHKEGFPLIHCGKRDPKKLEAELLKGTNKVVSLNNGEVKIVSGESYIEMVQTAKRINLE